MIWEWHVSVVPEKYFKEWKRGGVGHMKRLTEILLGTAGAYLAAICPRLVNRPEKLAGKYYAHRGLHNLQEGIPENTLPAFRKAVENGYGIELDVQLTKDRRVVVFHDFDLKRAAGTDRQVDSFTYKELEKIPLFSTGEHIPLFSDVLKLVAGKVPLIVEMKYKNAAGGICKEAQSLLAGYGGTYCIESFHPQALLWYRRYAPGVIRGQLAMRPKDMEDGGRMFYKAAEYLLTNCVTKPDFIAYDIRAKEALSKNLCRKLFQCPSVAWTVRSEQQLNEVMPYYDYFIFEEFLPDK